MENKDIIRLEFELWSKETGELVDTTKEGLAAEKGMKDPKAKYGPLPLIVGMGRMLKAMEDDLLAAKLGEDRELEIPPDDAYGKRDADLMSLVSIHEILRLPEFKKKDEMPEVGMEVELRGKRGVISSMTSGRVRVDFNHPLAGKTLVYKYKIVSKAEEIQDKVSWVIEGNYGSGEGFSIDVKGEEVDITLPDVCKYDENWFVSKFRVVSDMRDVLGIKTVRFLEEYTKKEDKKDENAEGVDSPSEEPAEEKGTAKKSSSKSKKEGEKAAGKKEGEKAAGMKEGEKAAGKKEGEKAAGEKSSGKKKADKAEDKKTGAKAASKTTTDSSKSGSKASSKSSGKKKTE